MWTETMTSAERMAALMKGEKPDRVPVIPFVFGHTALMCGQPLARVYDDAAESFRCQLLCQEMYGYDGGPLYAYASAGGWEFGGEIEFPYKKYSGAPVVARHPVQQRGGRPGSARRRTTSRPRARCPSPSSSRASRLSAGMPVTLQIGSPFTWAGSVIGEDRMMLWMLKKPALVHHVLDQVSDFVIRVAEHYAAEFGAENLMAFHGAATESNKLISPAQFESFVLPYYKAHQRARHRPGRALVLHSHLRRAEPQPRVLAAGAGARALDPELRSRGRAGQGHGDVPAPDHRRQRRSDAHPGGPARRGARPGAGAASRRPSTTRAATCSWPAATCRPWRRRSTSFSWSRPRASSGATEKQGKVGHRGGGGRGEAQEPHPGRRTPFARGE